LLNFQAKYYIFLYNYYAYII